MEDDKNETDRKNANSAPTKNEWGLPEWQDLNAYNGEDWSDYRWRWEFFRRREDLRKYFDHNAKKTYESRLELISQGYTIGAIQRPSEPGFCASGSDDTTRKFGYIGIPNPRISEQPEGAIRPLKNFGKIYRLVEGRRSKNALGEQLSHMRVPGLSLSRDLKSFLSKLYFDTFAVRLQPEQVSFTFDIDKPIEPQLAEARQTLRELQRKTFGKTAQKRRHKEKWATYLRVLDAREAGASWSEISDFLYTHAFLDRRSSPEGGYAPPPPQASRDLWQQANRLRDDFPL